MEVFFDNFGKTIALIIIVALAVIALFKINITFDLNDYLKSKKSKHLNAARHYCPHMEFQNRGDGPMQISWFESPSGTLAWICKNCGLEVNNIDEETHKKHGEYYLNNQKIYQKKLKKYNRHARKAS